MDAESSLHEKLTAEYDRIKGLDAENARLKKRITELCLGIDAVQLDTCTDEDWDRLNEVAKRAQEDVEKGSKPYPIGEDGWSKDPHMYG